MHLLVHFRYDTFLVNIQTVPRFFFQMKRDRVNLFKFNDMNCNLFETNIFHLQIIVCIYMYNQLKRGDKIT